MVKENPKGHPKHFKLTVGMRVLIQAVFMLLMWVFYQLYTILMPEFWLPMNIDISEIKETSNGHNLASFMLVHKTLIAEAFGNPVNKDIESVCTEVARKTAEDLFVENDTHKKVICAFLEAS